MRVESVHTLILGSGPSGLAAGYTLAKAGHKPVIIERDTTHGGLMRSIRHRDFVVDVGRKELYNRLEKVDNFWGALLGDDYRPYPHRGAFLYQGHLLEISGAHRGFRRGMPWPMFAGCILSFVGARLNVLASRPRTVQEYFYRTRGRRLTRIASQAFQEKLTGRKWSEIALPESFSAPADGLVSTLQAAAKRFFSKGEVNTYKNRWRHPAKGTGQICDALAKGITTSGGQFRFGAKILGIEKSADRVTAVNVESNGDQVSYRPEHLISAIPLEALLPLLGLPLPPAYLESTSKGAAQRRTVILVYLFLNRPPTFPHAWLQVTDPDTRIGRITNYSNFNAEMVPPGMGCLCCEYYCFGADPLLSADPKQLLEQTIEFCVKSKLMSRDSFVDEIVLKLPGADASQNRHNWMVGMRLGLLESIRPLKNLYYAGRTDLDIATLAGLESAEAILSGDRRVFDDHFDPDNIGIRSEGKSFAFVLPSGTA